MFMFFFEFDDMPLYHAGEFRFGLLNGRAGICIEDDYAWFVSSFTMRCETPFERYVTLDRQDRHFAVIEEALAREYDGAIADRTMEWMHDNGMDPPRSDYQEHSTYRTHDGKVS